MTEEQVECAVWLMLEYESHKDSLNVRGVSLLLDLRDEWNLQRAKDVMLVSEVE